MIHLLGIVLFSSGVGTAYFLNKKPKVQVADALPTLSTPSKALTQVEQAYSLEKEEASVNHYLRISGITLGVATVGHWLFPPVSLLSMPLLGYVGYPIFAEAHHNLKQRQVHISILDSMGFLIGIGVKLYILSAFAGLIYFTSAKLLFQSRNKTQQQFVDIFSGYTPTVWLLKEGVEVNVPLEQVLQGDRIIVNTGEMIPIDGVIEYGIASIDQHMLTGEAQPAEKTAGEPVFATTLVLAGRVVVRVEKTGMDTVAANITQVLARTDDYIADLQTRSEALANRSVLPTLGVSGVAWIATGPTAMLVVLTSNFSEVMQLNVALSMLNYLRIFSQAGLLIKDGRSLEQLPQVDTVVFDKTGTLTLEQPHVGAIYANASFTEQDVLYYAAAAEYRQTHPIARAILESAHQQNLTLPAIDSAEYKIGYGISVNLDGSRLQVGSRRFMQQVGISLTADFTDIERAAHEQGYSLIYVALGTTLCGVIELHPTVRPEARAVVEGLQKRGLEVHILSGDHAQPVKNLAEVLGVDGYIAETLPEDKSQVIAEMQARGKKVCFVGDGINDAIALKKAAVSVSLQDASTVAMDSAQVVLMNKNLLQLLDAFEVAQRFDRQQKWGITTTVVAPSLVTMGGAIFLGFGVPASLFLYCLSAVAGVGSSMLPLLQENPEKWHSNALQPTKIPSYDASALPKQ